MTTESRPHYLKTLIDLIWIYECIMSIPFVSFWLAWGTGGMTVLVGIGLHIAAAVLTGKNNITAPWQAGIVANILAFVPLVGWIFHIITAIGYSMTRKGQVVDYRGFIKPKNAQTTGSTQDSSSNKKGPKVNEAEIED